MPLESSLEEADGGKKFKYEELRIEAEQRGWKARVDPVEVGCRAFEGKDGLLHGPTRPSPRPSGPCSPSLHATISILFLEH